MTLTFEDFPLGRFGAFGPWHVSRDEIIAFGGTASGVDRNQSQVIRRRTLASVAAGSRLRAAMRRVDCRQFP